MGFSGKNTEVVCHSLLQWTTCCQTSPPWPDRLGWPHTAWLRFIELDKTVVLWSDWLVFCDYGFCESALWCALPTPTVLLRFLLPWTWSISSRLLQQSAAAALYLGRGVSPHACPSWPWMWSSSSQPSCARAATAPWRWGSSSQPPPLTSGMGLLLMAMLLRHPLQIPLFWFKHWEINLLLGVTIMRREIECKSLPFLPNIPH